MRLETVKVVNPNDPKGGYMIINKSEWEANKKSDSNKDGHELHETDPLHPDLSKEDKDAVLADQAAVDEAPKPKNTSGTFDEPTPTDIRYPNKDATEFEGNHGAFIGAGAAELRDANDMEQKPGGVIPEVHEAVKGAEAATAEAQSLAEVAKAKPKVARRLPQASAGRRIVDKKRSK